MSQPQTVVRVEALVKSYGDQRVVNEIALRVEHGECFGLLGPNGAGKTTTLRMMLGLTKPDSGKLFIFERDAIQHAREIRRQIGVVPQMDNLDPDFSVVENLHTYASYFGLRKKQVTSHIHELLEFVHLNNKTHATIESLSGGMKRRLTLARSLVNDPQLLILDEPTTGLDPQARQLIWQRLRELKQAGRTLILTTHYMEEAQRLCDRLAIMDHGQVICIGAPTELIRTHIEPHVIEVYGSGALDWAQHYAMPALARVEHLGETVFLYTEDETLLINELVQQSQLQFLHRRANLEDVFLKLTGRELRE